MKRQEKTRREKRGGNRHGEGQRKRKIEEEGGRNRNRENELVRNRSSG
jgi:hypothetical protein